MITGLDHVLIGVRDLEAARRAYLRLGFAATPRGRHIGWGTANYCLMFERDYVELLGIVDPHRFTNNLDRFLETREGLLGIAFASDDVERTADRLAAAGIAAGRPQDLKRVLELPEGEALPAFKLVHLPPEATPALSAFVCQHLTPHVVWRREWLGHPNAAAGLAALVTVVASPVDFADAYERLLGRRSVLRQDNEIEIQTGSARLVLTTQDGLVTRYPALEPLPAYPPPWLAALEITVADADRAARHLDTAGVPHVRGVLGEVLLSPRHACGVILAFTAS